LEADAEAEVALLVELATTLAECEEAETEAEDTAEDAAEVAAAELAAGTVDWPAALVAGAVLPAAPVPETLAFTQDESDEFWIVIAEEYWTAPVLSRTWMVIEVP